MVHARADYQRFQDPALSDPSLLGEGSTPIAANEPVLLFRAQDKHSAAVAEFYAGLIRAERIETERYAGECATSALRSDEAYAKADDKESLGAKCQRASADASHFDKSNAIDRADSLLRVEKAIVHHARLMRLWPKKKTPDIPA